MTEADCCSESLVVERVIGSIGFSEFHSINTKSKVQDDLREAEERLKNAKDTDSHG